MLACASLVLALTGNHTSRELGAHQHQCSDAFQPCWDTKCCNGAAWECHKKQGKQFAQCKRVPEDGCRSDGEWACESTWANCATPAFGDCWSSMCCSNPAHACLRRGTRHFAQCRPMADCQAEGSEWLCPGWTRPDGSTEALTASAPPPPQQCSQPFQPCTDTHCCEGRAFRCIERKNKFFAQCIRPESCVSDDTHQCNDIEGTPVASPPPPDRHYSPQNGGASTAGGYGQQQQQPLASMPTASTGGSSMGLIVVFLLAVGAGVAGVFLYKRYSIPSPPTEPPRADDPETAGPTRAPKGSKSSKSKLVEEDDYGEEDEAESKKKKKSKGGKSKRGNGEDAERLRGMDDVDQFD